MKDVLFKETDGDDSGAGTGSEPVRVRFCCWQPHRRSVQRSDDRCSDDCCSDGSGAAVGAKVTLHASNGCQVTGTTTSGVAEIVAKDGDVSGSRVLVKFS